MPSTYSPSLKLELIGNGEQAGTWGTTTNNNLGTLLEQAITGVLPLTLTGDVTLTDYNGLSDQARNAVLMLNGLLGAPCNVIVPPSQKVYIVRNFSNATVTIKTSSGNGVALTNAASAVVFCDGANVYSATTLNYIDGNLTVTGTTTLGGILTCNSAVVLKGDVYGNTNTGQWYLPVGTTAQRTSSPIEGLIRYNSLGDFYEGYANSTWVRFLVANEDNYILKYLSVAGGGGGSGGGGGGGGAINSQATVTPTTVFTIIVGAGGATGTNGANSSISTLAVSVGGGSGSIYGTGGSGGSGGGAYASGTGGGAGPFSGGAGTSGQGTSGGSSDYQGAGQGGGGGGGNSPGASASAPTATGGAGGTGLLSTVTGVGVYFAGGGGGGCAQYGGGSGGAGGTGGGGAGDGYSGAAGSANSGGGGGGGGGGPTGAPPYGSNGGSGVVILSMPTINYSGSYTGSPSVSTSGSNTVLQFNSSGTYTA